MTSFAIRFANTKPVILKRSGRVRHDGTSKKFANASLILECALRRCTCSQTRESMASMKSIRVGCIVAAVVSAAFFIGEVPALSGLPNSRVSTSGSTATQRDGAHDFDFLIGDWKAHVRRLPERLNTWWISTKVLSSFLRLWAISNDAGRVKRVLILFLPVRDFAFSLLGTPLRLRGSAVLPDG